MLTQGSPAVAHSVKLHSMQCPGAFALRLRFGSACTRHDSGCLSLPIFISFTQIQYLYPALSGLFLLPTESADSPIWPLDMMFLF